MDSYSDGNVFKFPEDSPKWAVQEKLLKLIREEKENIDKTLKYHEVLVKIDDPEKHIKGLKTFLRDRKDFLTKRGIEVGKIYSALASIALSRDKIFPDHSISLLKGSPNTKT